MSFLNGLSSTTLECRKRRRAFGSVGEETEEPLPKKRVSREVIVVEDDDDKPTTRGRGSLDDPIIFTQWSTGNLISNSTGGSTIVISDDEEDEVEITSNQARNPYQRHSEAASTPSVWHNRDESPLLETQSPGLPTSTINDEDGSESNEFPPRSPSAISQTTFAEGTLSLKSEYAECDGSPLQGEDTDREEEDEYMASEEDEDITREEDEDVGREEDEGVCGNGEDKEDLFIFENIKQVSGRHPWTCAIKEEDESGDELPEFSFSQDSVSSGNPTTPGSSQNMLDQLSPSVSRKSTTNPRTTAGHLGCSRVDESSTTVGLKTKDTLKERKRLFWTRYWKTHLVDLQYALHKLYQDTTMAKGDECWLYRGPRVYQHTRAVGIFVTFGHQGRRLTLTINAAYIAMLLAGYMTDSHRQGIIEHAWHASHLCGNFTCLNPRHINAESGSTNGNRNACFNDRCGPCSHDPQCLKHLKVDIASLRPIRKPKGACAADESPMPSRNSWGWH